MFSKYLFKTAILLISIPAVISMAAELKPGVAASWPELITDNPLESDRPVKEKLMLVSWGDICYFYGPETDPGLQTPQQVANMMKYWKDLGFTQIFWRIEYEGCRPPFKWNDSTIYADGSFVKAIVEGIHRNFDDTKCAIEEAHKLGMKVILWYSVYDDGTPPDKMHRFWGNVVDRKLRKDGQPSAFPWRNTFFDKNPELEVCDRAGNPQWGVRELAYPLARKAKIDKYLYFVKKYNLDGVFLYMHSHSCPGYDGDQYGFNQSIVEEYQKRYGVNILTDLRFDYQHPAFDPNDEAVEKWRSLRGEYLTQFIRELRTAIKKIRPDMTITINTQGGDYMGPPFGNMRVDWRTWIKEGLIDQLIVRTWMAGGCGSYDFSKEHYLTWADGEIGGIPYDEIRKVINGSGHKVNLISRSRRYIDGVDGWYIASNYDNAFAQRQRTQQLKENMAKYGRIGFIEQDFDTSVPLEKVGFLDCTFGGKRYFVGDERYFASKNTSPGFAGPLTTEMKVSPALVNVSKTGGKGNAVFLDGKGRSLSIIRMTGIDWPDAPVSMGKVIVSFDIYKLSGDTTITVTALLHKESDANSMVLSFARNNNLTFTSNGRSAMAVAEIAPISWVPIQMQLDIDIGTCLIMVSGKKVSEQPCTVGKMAFDGLGFRCDSGSGYVDNIKVILTK